MAEHAAILYFWLLIGFYLVSPKMAYNFMERVENHAYDTYGGGVENHAYDTYGGGVALGLNVTPSTSVHATPMTHAHICHLLWYGYVCHT